MDTSTLLIEIFTEELPFSAIKKELKNILPAFQNALKSQQLNAEIEFFYTPRRLILYSQYFPLKQSDKLHEFFGPPLEIAYKNGAPTEALNSFVKKLNIDKNDIQIKAKNAKDCLYFAKIEAGIESRYLIEDIILAWLESLNFGKSMRWGAVESSFIRPIRNIFILLNDEMILLKKANKKFGFMQTSEIFPHRNCAPKEIKKAKDYFLFLENNFVLYSQHKRKNKILDEIAQIEQSRGIRVEIDENLLDEIIAITEYPTALYGEFSRDFLRLPNEVIITSMKINQKYFATFGSNGALNNGFVVVANSIDSFLLVTKGNERVLSARLSDALFFYENDLRDFYQHGIDERLKNIEFIEGFGSLFDKVQREGQIASILMAENGLDSAQILEAIKLSKNDLISEMVGEFGELCGIMGAYYAKKQNLKNALNEQYLGESALPNSIDGAICAICNKLDSIFVLFCLNKIPSGSKDPYALRRAANGIIKIIYKFKLHLNIANLAKAYKNLNIASVEQFFYERLEGVLEINQSVINAALKAKKSDLLALIENIYALDSINKSLHKEALRAIFKRVANILSPTNAREINPDLLQKDEEKELYKKLVEFYKIDFQSPQERINELLKFRQCLEKFFDSVLINVENIELKENRILLVKAIYEEFLKVGDIKEISL